MADAKYPYTKHKYDLENDKLLFAFAAMLCICGLWCTQSEISKRKIKVNLISWGLEYIMRIKSITVNNLEEILKNIGKC